MLIEFGDAEEPCAPEPANNDGLVKRGSTQYANSEVGLLRRAIPRPIPHWIAQIVRGHKL